MQETLSKWFLYSNVCSLPASRKVMWNENPIPSSAKSIRTDVHFASETEFPFFTTSSKSLTIIVLLRCQFCLHRHISGGIQQDVQALAQRLFGDGQGCEHLDHFIIRTRGLNDEALLKGTGTDRAGGLASPHIDTLHHAAALETRTRHDLGDGLQSGGEDGRLVLHVILKTVIGP